MDEFDKIVKHFLPKLQNLIDMVEAKGKELSQKIKDNYDPRPKKVGDRVAVWNDMSMTDYNQKSIELKEMPKYFVVLKVQQETKLEVKEGGLFFFSIQQDLVIGNPETRKAYRVASADVKLVTSKGVSLK